MPLLDRRRLRWLNGAGVALTLFFAAWLIFYLLALVSGGFRDVSVPMPIPHAVVGGLSMVAMVVFLGILLLGYAAQGADLSHGRPRHYLFAWTCASALFCISQTVVVLQRGGDAFSHVPVWASQAYWYFALVGAAVFPVLLWVNAEGVRAAPGDEDEAYDEYDDAYEDSEDHEDPDAGLDPSDEFAPQHLDGLD